MSALVSAGIELVPHQIAAVRRILADPVQRYLLADEVGLGNGSAELDDNGSLKIAHSGVIRPPIPI